MEQLKLSMQTAPRNFVDALYARARMLGWEPDPQGAKGRWWLPGTPYRFRANFHTTAIYCLLGHTTYAKRLVATRNLTALAIVLEHVALYCPVMINAYGGDEEETAHVCQSA